MQLRSWIPGEMEMDIGVLQDLDQRARYYWGVGHEYRMPCQEVLMQAAREELFSFPNEAECRDDMGLPEEFTRQELLDFLSE